MMFLLSIIDTDLFFPSSIVVIWAHHTVGGTTLQVVESVAFRPAI